MLEITESDFQRLVRFVKQNYGIDLSKKKQLITGRLSNTIIGMGFTSFQQYVDHLLQNKKPEDLELMLNKLYNKLYLFYARAGTFRSFCEYDPSLAGADKDEQSPEHLERRLLFR